MGSDRVFSSDLLEELREMFFFVEGDEHQPKRVYFENSGGALRLKSVVEAAYELAKYPDSSSRPNKSAKILMDAITQGKQDFKSFINASKGSIVTNYTASRVLFNITEAIIFNASGTNVVTTVLDHPATYDSALFYCQKYGKDFRVCKANKQTGGIDVDAVLKHVDESTCLLSMIHASNITGAIMDVEHIIKEVKKINPDIYILLDSVQHAPHGVIDFDHLGIDAVVVDPYKMFGLRGSGFGFVSERVSTMPHERVLGKNPDVWEIGSADPVDFASMSKLVEYYEYIGSKFTDSNDKRTKIITGISKVESRESFLLERLLEGTDSIPGLRHLQNVTVHFDNKDLEKRDLIVAITIDTLRCSEAVEKYDNLGFTVFERLATSPFSKRMMEAFDLEGIIRVSPMHFNTTEEIDAFLEATSAIASA